MHGSSELAYGWYGYLRMGPGLEVEEIEVAVHSPKRTLLGAIPKPLRPFIENFIFILLTIPQKARTELGTIQISCLFYVAALPPGVSFR
jgi:hypothetical protein